ncbi:hypothetical protein J1614_007271 [Plenodomus biglobosus]|nr:hypothetical protein J1614_007271 [Plenodomus biglobosus]
MMQYPARALETASCLPIKHILDAWLLACTRLSLPIRVPSLSTTSAACFLSEAFCCPVACSCLFALDSSLGTVLVVRTKALRCRCPLGSFTPYTG